MPTCARLTLLAGSEANADALMADLREFMGKTSGVAGRNMDHKAPEHDERGELVDANDRRRKNVDSGKVAIIFCTDSVVAFKDK